LGVRGGEGLRGRPCRSALLVLLPLEQTIFEINATARTLGSTVMRSKRRHDRALIEKYQRGQQEKWAAVLKGQGQCPAAPRPEEGGGGGEEEDLQVTGQGRGACRGHRSCCAVAWAGCWQHRGCAKAWGPVQGRGTHTRLP